MSTNLQLPSLPQLRVKSDSGNFVSENRNTFDFIRPRLCTGQIIRSVSPKAYFIHTDLRSRVMVSCTFEYDERGAIVVGANYFFLGRTGWESRSQTCRLRFYKTYTKMLTAAYTEINTAD